MIKSKKYITQKQFIRYLKYTPYFIWNSLDELIALDEIDQSMQDNDDSFQWIKFDQEDFMNIDFDYQNQYSLKELKATQIIQDKTNEFLENKFLSFYYIKSKKIDDAIKETKKIINEKKYDFIINPIFKYKDAIARPKGFDVKNNCIYLQKFSAATKKQDWCEAYWNYKIINANIKVDDINLIVLSSGPNRKNEINFILSPTANIQATCQQVKFAKIMDKNLGEGEMGVSRFSLEIMNRKNNRKSGIENIDNKNLTFKKVFIDDNSNKHSVGNKLKALNIDLVIKEINDAREIKKYSSTLKEEMEKIHSSIISHNEIKKILKLHNFDNWDISGKIIRQKDYIKIILNDLNTYKHNGLLENIFQKKNDINKEIVEEIIKPINNNHNRVIWYDFEGYSLPTATVDFFPPFQQTIFQVSIIETKNNVVQNKINKVYDPKWLSGNTFVDIINWIYSLQAEVYVVYNRQYENTRIKEMVDWLLFTNHPFAHQAYEKGKWIIEKTVDLADLFEVQGKTKKPPIFLWELKGMYSIKLIEKYIHKHNINLPVKIHEYSKLEIQNGMMAMDIAIERSLGIIGDKKWMTHVQNLKIYCENDVNAMRMVFEFAKYLLNNVKS